MPESKLKPASSITQSTLSIKVKRWLKDVVGLDRAIVFTIFARVWQSAAGLITIFLITRLLSPVEQGYYYTFISLVALQIVFELGFSFVIQQMASHERANLDISPDYQVSGDPVAHARLASVLQKTVRWYSIAAVLMAGSLISAGFYFFSHHQGGSAEAGWKTPWCCVALAASLTFKIDPILAFLEGCGYVANVARLRMAQAMLGSLLAWSALILHHGLYAPAMMITGMATAGIAWLFRRRRFLIGLLRHEPGEHVIQWRREVWPFQWKIAVSWISGYFIFQLFNPVLFAYRGAVSAGQMGMSLNVATALQTIAISWINTKSAPFGTMIARKQYRQLDQIFFRSLRQSITACMIGALLLLVGLIYLNQHSFAFAHRLLSLLAHRLLPPLDVGLLLCAVTTNIVVFAEALYLRAHKQEKFLLNSILTAIFVSLSTLYLGRIYGARGMIVGYLITVVIISLGQGTYTFFKYRKIWHAE